MVTKINRLNKEKQLRKLLLDEKGTITIEKALKRLEKDGNYSNLNLYCPSD